MQFEPKHKIGSEMELVKANYPEKYTGKIQAHVSAHVSAYVTPKPEDIRIFRKLHW